MKAFRSAILLSFLALSLNSCFEEPNFPTTPEIVFNDIFLQVTPSITEADTLVLLIDFKDGNGDLGLGSETDIDTSDPYHPFTYYQKDGNGGLQPVPTFKVGQYTVLNPPTTDKMITNRTRNETGYGSLPAYDMSLDPGCQPYVVEDLLVSDRRKEVLENTDVIFDTLEAQEVINGVIVRTPYYHFRDTLYAIPNDNHYNITIDFLVKNNDGTFTKFDWTSLCENYDGRFPVLSYDEPQPLEGTIRYKMQSNGWLPLFSIKTMKLRIYIKDRALNKSNVIETPEFTMDKIRR